MAQKRRYGVWVPAFAGTSSSHSIARMSAATSGTFARNRFPHIALLMRATAANQFSTCRHLRADFGTHRIDQHETLAGLDMPEGPAIACTRALRYRADPMNGADLVAEHDGAIGANQRSVTLLGIEELGARRNHAALDQFRERDPRSVARGHEWRKRGFGQSIDSGDARFRRRSVSAVAFKADVAAAETFCDRAGGA